MKSQTQSLDINDPDQTANPMVEQNSPDQSAILKGSKRGRGCLTKPSEIHQKMIELSGSLTPSEIARCFEVSRQRVHQIFRRWPDLCPKRAIVSKATAAMPTKRKRERREVIICFRLTSRQVGRAKELLGSLGIRKERSSNAACRAVLLIAMNSFSADSQAANQDELKAPGNFERSAANRADGTL
jgi:hypothetical protein